MMPADLFDVHFRELTIRGAFGGGEAYHRALDLLPQVPSVERVVTSSYPHGSGPAKRSPKRSDPAGVKVAIRPNG